MVMTQHLLYCVMVIIALILIFVTYTSIQCHDLAVINIWTYTHFCDIYQPSSCKFKVKISKYLVKKIKELSFDLFGIQCLRFACHSFQETSKDPKKASFLACFTQFFSFFYSQFLLRIFWANFGSFPKALLKCFWAHSTNICWLFFAGLQ